MKTSGRTERLHQLLADAKALGEEDDPVLDKAMPRVVAIVHDALRLLDLDYVDDIVNYA